MKRQTLKGLEARLTYFLEDLLEPMGRSERRHWAQVYVQGLLLDGERKSIEPMASRIPGADVQALASLWDRVRGRSKKSSAAWRIR
jgi:SRSO17 transposase